MDSIYSKGDMFWDLIEVKMQCEVETHLRTLLRLRGFSNVVSVKEMYDEDIMDVENFAKSDRIKTFIPERADLKDYFGEYANDPNSFEISRGSKKMLKEIVRYSRENYDAFGAAFFDPYAMSNRMFSKTIFEKVSRNEYNAKAKKDLRFENKTVTAAGQKRLYEIASTTQDGNDSDVILGHRSVRENQLHELLLGNESIQNNFASIIPPLPSKSQAEKTVGVLCNYYTWNINGLLEQYAEEGQHKFYLDIKNYKATVPEPSFDKGILQINLALLNKLEEIKEKDIRDILDQNNQPPSNKNPNLAK